MKRTILLVAAVLATCGADWPQFRGPNRDDVSKETGLLKTWPKEGPPLLWTYKDAGVGYSGPAIVGDRLYLMGARGEDEFVFALDIKDPKAVKQVWTTKIGPKFTWKGNNWNAGPITTPTVGGDSVYALGGQGILVCVDAEKGTERWRKDLPKDLGAEINPIGGGPEKIGWGFTWAPLVDGDQVICVPGGPQGTVAALDKKSGSVKWQSKGLIEQASYSSPIVAEVGGVRQYIVLLNSGLVGVAAADGKLLWKYTREEPFGDCTIPTPIFHDNMVYITAGGEGASGCDLIKLSVDGSKITPQKVYGQKNIENYHGGVVKVGDFVYGASEGPGWSCQDFKTGEIKWSEKRKLGKGSITCADGLLYCYAEKDGTTVLIEPSPTAWKELGRFKIPAESKQRRTSGKVWTHPVVANGRLYLRDQELLFCYDVKAKGK